MYRALLIIISCFYYQYCQAMHVSDGRSVPAGLLYSQVFLFVSHTLLAISYWRVAAHSTGVYGDIATVYSSSECAPSVHNSAVCLCCLASCRCCHPMLPTMG